MFTTFQQYLTPRLQWIFIPVVGGAANTYYIKNYSTSTKSPFASNIVSCKIS